ncbi:MAG: type II toxin-antitoxin system VapC family toxin [Alphaproteobacteria bacterium]|nr:type II toxin-antitoxin system VapC family toxin [Alphaproteobacteria bacterium]
MLVDSSALVAVLEEEPEAALFASLMYDAEHLYLSAATLLEVSIVMQSRRKERGENALNELLSLYKVEIVPFTSDQADLARRAHKRYGRGNHPAKLNFGDCISYAVAKDMGEPLLYKGEDFDKTDCEKVDWQSCVHKDN